MTSDANSPRARRSDSRRGVAIGVVTAIIVGAIIWCVVHGDPKSGLAACRGKRVRDERDFWRQGAEHRQHAEVPDCLYVAEQVISELLAPEDLGKLRVALRPAEATQVADIDGEVPQRLPGAGPYRELQLYEYDDESVDPLDVATEITERTGRLATPNYLMVSTQIWKYGSADKAQPTYTTSSIPVLTTSTGSTVPQTNSPGTVVVVDTGFDTDGLVAPSGSVKNADRYTANVAVDTKGPDEVGHGTFIASRIRGATQPSDVPVSVVAVGGLTKLIQLLPDSTEPTLTISDWQFAFAVLYGTQRAVSADPGQTRTTVLNLSFGSYGCGKGSSNTAGVVVGDGAFKFTESSVCATAGVRSALLALKASGYIDYVTAAAGNDSSSSAFFPAAFSEEACFHTLNVGASCQPVRETAMQNTWLFAVGTNGSLPGKLPYSNKGSFVNIKAKGTLVAGLLPKTVTRSLAGYYVWSGTSFAAPCVASFLAVGQLQEVRKFVRNKPSNEMNCG